MNGKGIMEKVYYSIRETADMLGVALSKLRYWEQEFEEIQPKHYNGSPRRFYSAEDVALLRRIQYLSEEQHLPIEAVRLRLRQGENNLDRTMQVRKSLMQLREELAALREMI